MNPETEEQFEEGSVCPDCENDMDSCDCAENVNEILEDNKQ